MNKLWNRFTHFWQSASSAEQWQWFVVAVATALGATYRLYNIRFTLQFLADQGRDAIIALGILHGDIALVGPSTSVGEMYLGPFYYYFMAPFLLLAGFDPVGPALAVATIGILTIPLLYWVGRQLVGKWPAFFATLLYASAPIVAEYSRFSWNPNPAPAVMLLLVYGIWRAIQGKLVWWIWTAFWFAIIIQLHYVAAIAILPIVVFGLFQLGAFIREKQWERVKSLLQITVVSFVLIALSFAPLLAFNWRFNGIITQGFEKFMQRDSSSNASSTLTRIWQEKEGRSLNVFFELWGNKDWSMYYRQTNQVLLWVYLLALVFVGFRLRKTKWESGYWLIVVTTLATVVGLAWYQGPVYFHYFSFFFPFSYLVTGLVIVELVYRFRWLGKGAALGLMAYIFWLSVQPASLLYTKSLGWNVDNMADVSRTILENISEDQSYALTSLTEIRDYRGLNYRYFLLSTSHPPVSLEAAAQADILVVIAENPREKDDVLGSPVYEIVTFPKGEYRTVDYPGGPRLYFIERSASQQ